MGYEERQNEWGSFSIIKNKFEMLLKLFHHIVNQDNKLHDAVSELPLCFFFFFLIHYKFSFIFFFNAVPLQCVFDIKQLLFPVS